MREGGERIRNMADDFIRDSMTSSIRISISAYLWQIYTIHIKIKKMVYIYESYKMNSG